MTEPFTHPSTEAAQWRKSTGSWPHPCPNGACSHGGHFHDIDTYEEPRPMCTFEDCPCGKPTTAPSTEAVGEVRRQIAEQIAARYAAGWLDPAAAKALIEELTETRGALAAEEEDRRDTYDEFEKLRSDLSAMTSDRDWLRSEFEKASAEIARLRHSLVWRGDRCRTCGGKEPKHQMWCRLFVGPVTHSWVKQIWNDFHKEWRHLCSCGAEKSDTFTTDPGPCPRSSETWRGAQPTAAGTKED